MSAYLPWLVYAAASVVFWLGAVNDAKSSRGMKEYVPFLRNAAGRFNLKRYLIIMIGIYLASLVFPFVGQDTLTFIASGFLAMGGVFRLIVAGRNRKLPRKV